MRGQSTPVVRRALRRADFERARRQGLRMESRLFISLLVERDLEPAQTGADPRSRLGITVTRKVGNAVRRNRIKRLVREWYRQSSAELGARDLVVIAKRNLPERLGLGDVVRDLDSAIAAWRRRSA